MSFRIALAAVLLAAVSTPSHAEVATRTLTSGPANYCQSALPVFDGNIRKRPLAVANEGTGTAFITCSFPLQGNGGTLLQMYFSNASGSVASLNCTGVTGYQGQSLSVTKTISLPTSGQMVMNFQPAEFEAGTTSFLSGFISVSCEMKPGFSINDSYVYLREDIGN